jgi:hypothetical protein
MKPLRDTVRAHVAEHGAVLAWQRRVGAEHAAEAQRGEDEALERYQRAAALLAAVFSEDATSLQSLLAPPHDAPAALAAARLAAAQAAAEAAAGGAGADVAAPDGPAAPSPHAAAAAAREAALSSFMERVGAAGSFAALAAARADYGATLSVPIALPPDVARALQQAAAEAAGGGGGGASDAAAAPFVPLWQAMHAEAAAAWSGGAAAVAAAAAQPRPQRISAEELEAALADAPQRAALQL